MRFSKIVWPSVRFSFGHNLISSKCTTVRKIYEAQNVYAYTYKVSKRLCEHFNFKYFFSMCHLLRLWLADAQATQSGLSMSSTSVL